MLPAANAAAGGAAGRRRWQRPLRPRYCHSRCCHARRLRRQYGARPRIGGRSRSGVSESWRRRYITAGPWAYGHCRSRLAARRRRGTSAQRKPGRAPGPGGRGAAAGQGLHLHASACAEWAAEGPASKPYRHSPLFGGGLWWWIATSAASTAPCTTLRPRRHTLGVAPACAGARIMGRMPFSPLAQPVFSPRAGGGKDVHRGIVHAQMVTVWTGGKRRCIQHQ